MEEAYNIVTKNKNRSENFKKVSQYIKILPDDLINNIIGYIPLRIKPKIHKWEIQSSKSYMSSYLDSFKSAVGITRPKLRHQYIPDVSDIYVHRKIHQLYLSLIDVFINISDKSPKNKYYNELIKYQSCPTLSSYHSNHIIAIQKLMTMSEKIVIKLCEIDEIQFLNILLVRMHLCPVKNCDVYYSEMHEYRKCDLWSSWLSSNNGFEAYIKHELMIWLPHVCNDLQLHQGQKHIYLNTLDEIIFILYKLMKYSIHYDLT